jgi:hypothetical protein
MVGAFDISPVGVAKADELARRTGVSVKLHMCDCDCWDWRPEAYDVVAAVFVQFAGAELRRRLFARMIATFTPGGYLIVQGYTPRQPGYKLGKHREGTRHVGPSALPGMVARKPSA